MVKPQRIAAGAEEGIPRTLQLFPDLTSAELPSSPPRPQGAGRAAPVSGSTPRHQVALSSRALGRVWEVRRMDATAFTRAVSCKQRLPRTESRVLHRGRLLPRCAAYTSRGAGESWLIAFARSPQVKEEIMTEKMRPCYEWTWTRKDTVRKTRNPAQAGRWKRFATKLGGEVTRRTAGFSLPFSLREIMNEEVQA